MTSETQQKKQVQVLQRCIVNALEDVKAIDIQVFNTEHLSPLFERVIVASGNSNRQTKALAASVRDDVREAGFDKPRIEGEENGEWIIVDCGAAVVHIMQPAIRAYYRLEEIWGDKPVKLRSAAPVKPSSTSTSSTKATKAPSAKAAVKSTPKKSPVSKAKKPAAGKSAANAPQSTRKSTTAVKKASSSAKSTPVKRAAASTKPTATPKAAAAKKPRSTAPRKATPKSSNSAARPTRKTSPK